MRRAHSLSHRIRFSQITETERFMFDTETTSRGYRSFIIFTIKTWSQSSFLKVWLNKNRTLEYLLQVSAIRSRFCEIQPNVKKIKFSLFVCVQWTSFCLCLSCTTSLHPASTQHPPVLHVASCRITPHRSRPCRAAFPRQPCKHADRTDRDKR